MKQKIQLISFTIIFQSLCLQFTISGISNEFQLISDQSVTQLTLDYSLFLSEEELKVLTKDQTFNNIEIIYLNNYDFHIIDGDTLLLNDKQNNTSFKVRYLYIDTPELHHPTKKRQYLGLYQKEVVENILLNSKEDKIIITVDTDLYNRKLGIIFIKVKLSNKKEQYLNLNQFLVRIGLQKPLLVKYYYDPISIVSYKQITQQYTIQRFLEINLYQENFEQIFSFEIEDKMLYLLEEKNKLYFFEQQNKKGSMDN